MRKTLVLDSTQISQFYECQEKWHLANEEQLVKLGSEEEEDDSKELGSYFHKLLEVYYKNRSLGISVAVSKALQILRPGNISEELDKRLRERFEFYWMTYCNQDIEPVKRTVHKIAFNDEGVPKDFYIGEPLVEQGFSYELYNTSEYLFVLEGKIDLIGELSGSMVFMDHKTQLRARKLYAKSIQFRNYSLVTGIKMGIVNYIRLHKAVTEDTLKRDLIFFNPIETKLWREELIDKFVSTSKAVETGHFERNRDSCAGKYGYPCLYTRICDELPAMRESVKQNHYERRKEVWKPW